MKKVLYILQQSILDNSRNWMSADSNINMAAGFFRSWIARNNVDGFDVDVLIAPLNAFGDIFDYCEVFPNHDRLHFIEYPMTRNAALNRMDFRSFNFRDVIHDKDYDIIINCVPEWTLGIKTSYDVEKKKMPKIVAQCFWLDTPMIGEPKQPEHLTLQFRQAEGFALSDLVVFTCASTKRAWIENAVKLLAPYQLLNIMNKSTIWDFGYSQHEVTEMIGNGSMRMFEDVARIGFLNRMGSDGYTNAAVFVDALRLLKDDPAYADRFEVVFTNPSKRVSEEWLQENVPNFVSFNEGNPLNRQEYFQFLYECDITVHLFVKERYGGCALRESIAAGNYTIVADCFEQGDIVKDNLLKVSPSSLTPVTVASALRYAIDVVLSSEKLNEDDLDRAGALRMRTVNENYRRCSFESQLDVVLADLAKLIDASL